MAITKLKNKQRSTVARANGESFENMLQVQHNQYLRRRVACISKVPTATKPIKQGRKTVWIPDKKTGTDFLGVYRGMPIAIESKSVNSKTSFPVMMRGQKMVKQHQQNFLRNFYECGGLAYVVIYLQPLNKLYRLNIIDYQDLEKEVIKMERKSIPLSMLEEYEVQLNDYLGGLA